MEEKYIMEEYSALKSILGFLLAIGVTLFSVYILIRVIWQIIRAMVTAIFSAPASLSRLYFSLSRLYFFLKEYPSVISIVSTNVFPLLGVIWLNWSLFSILLLYWSQSIIIGYFSILKLRKMAEVIPEPQRISVMAFAVRKPRKAQSPEIIIREFKGVYIFGIVGSFILFMVLAGLSEARGIEGPFLYKTVPAIIREFQETFISVAGGFLLFLLNHSFSYFSNFVGKHEYSHSTLRQQIEIPLGRVGAIWCATFLAAVWAVALPSGHLFTTLIVLVSLKTLIDVGAHLQERTGNELVWRSLPPWSLIRAAARYGSSKDATG